MLEMDSARAQHTSETGGGPRNFEECSSVVSRRRGSGLEAGTEMLELAGTDDGEGALDGVGGVVEGFGVVCGKGGVHALEMFVELAEGEMEELDELLGAEHIEELIEDGGVKDRVWVGAGEEGWEDGGIGADVEGDAGQEGHGGLRRERDGWSEGLDLGGADGFEELVGGEGFEKKGVIADDEFGWGLAATYGDGGSIGVQVRVKESEERGAGRAGHVEVREEEVRRGWKRVEQSEGGLAVFGGKGGVADGREVQLDDLTAELVVIDEKDGEGRRHWCVL